MRRCLAQAVMLALMLPVLIGALPLPALSAAEALDRDLLIFACGQDVPQQPDHRQQHQGHDNCMLCGSHCPSGSPSLAAAVPAFTAAPRRMILSRVAAAAVPPPLQALLDASPPRGPPAFV